MADLILTHLQESSSPELIIEYILKIGQEATELFTNIPVNVHICLFTQIMVYVQGKCISLQHAS